MLIPYNTDAPIYYPPVATLLLIAANVCCFVATGGGGAGHADTWVLEYGTTLNPLEWFLSMFFHRGLLHLIGNLFFLWAFGLVVEGKVGWHRFLVLYFGIGIAERAVEQTLMLRTDGDTFGSAGASGAIFGIMAIALVWAPQNDLICFVFALIRGLTFSISIKALSLLYLVLQVVFVLIRPLTMTSAVIHLLGAAIGGAVGVWMLKSQRVDCENWDLLSVLRGRAGSGVLPRAASYEGPNEAARKLTESGEFFLEANAESGTEKVRRLLDEKKYDAALRELQSVQHLLQNFRLPVDELGMLARGLCRKQRWEVAVPVLEEYIERFPDSAHGMRTRLAAILCQVRRRPRAALRVIDQVDTHRLNDQQREELRKIISASKKLIDSGHIEVQDA